MPAPHRDAGARRLRAALAAGEHEVFQRGQALSEALHQEEGLGVMGSPLKVQRVQVKLDQAATGGGGKDELREVEELRRHGRDNGFKGFTTFLSIP